MTLDEYFKDQAESRKLFEAVHKAVKAIGPAELRVTQSQVAFRRKKAFATLWMPAKYLHRKSAPLVLTLGFHKRDPSPRWKEVIEAKPGRFTHHLELYSKKDIDDEVREWLRMAWVDAA